MQNDHADSDKPHWERANIQVTLDGVEHDIGPLEKEAEEPPLTEEGLVEFRWGDGKDNVIDIPTFSSIYFICRRSHAI